MRNLFFLLLIIVLYSYSSDKSQQELKEQKPLSFLHTSGHFMVNEQNDTILLRGVGLGNWLLPEGYMWHFGSNGDRPRKIEKMVEDLTSKEFSENFWKEFRLNFITEADIKKVKELGFNSVRPAMNARVFLTEGDTAVFIEENFGLLDSLISWCGKYGIYVILDMHGAPGGQTGQNIDDSPNNEPELFTDQKYEQRLTRLWLKLADRYKDNPVVAGYDLLNEPLPENTGAAEKYKHLLLPMYKKLTQEIRKIDKKHMIILEGYNWSNNWSIFTKTFDDNVVYQFHYYCWNNPDNLNDISHYIKERERLNAPVWVGETGERNPSIYYATTQYFEKNNIGWSFWPWKKIDNQEVIYSVKAPENYDQIIQYSRTGEKPSQELAEAVFTQLLENIKVENCEFRELVSKALFRQVPGKIYAVNYGHEGAGISYSASNNLNAEYYRTNEPVKTVLVPNERRTRRGSEQAVLLNEKEWTNYTFNALENFSGNITVKVKAEMPSSIAIIVNGKENNVTLAKTEWEELIIEDQNFTNGVNSLKTEIKDGSAMIMYFEIEKSGAK